jgi:hypothetical protein
MQRAFVAVSTLALFSSQVFAQKPAQLGARPQFEGPEVVAVGELVHPANSIAYGTIATEVTVGPTGKVESVRVIRDVVSLTSEAVRDVKT